MNRRPCTQGLMAALAAIIALAAARVVFTGEVIFDPTPLDKKALQAKFVEQMDSIKEQTKTDISTAAADAKTEAEEITKELQSISDQLRKLLRPGSLDMVERRRRRSDLKIRENLLKARAAYIVTFFKNKKADLTRRSRILCARLSADGRELSDRIDDGETITTADADARIRQCLKEYPCRECEGTGSVGCSTCDQTGKMKVKMVCPDCGGLREVPRRQGGIVRPQPCTRCGATGHIETDITCTTCFGEGHRECPVCLGKGTVLDPPPKEKSDDEKDDEDK